MDWNRGPQCIMNVGVNSVCSNLGYVEDGIYIASDECEGIFISSYKWKSAEEMFLFILQICI